MFSDVHHQRNLFIRSWCRQIAITDVAAQTVHPKLIITTVVIPSVSVASVPLKFETIQAKYAEWWGVPRPQIDLLN